MSEILVQDNDTLIIVAKTGPSAWDPEGDYPAIANAYRVVASLGGEHVDAVLELIPLGPVNRLEKSELKDVERRKGLDKKSVTNV